MKLAAESITADMAAPLAVLDANPEATAVFIHEDSGTVSAIVADGEPQGLHANDRNEALEVARVASAHAD